MSSYAEKLKDPRWQKKRLEVLEAAGWECHSCGDRENELHVHHNEYISGREPWEYETQQFSVLCVPCHEACDKMRGVIREMLSLLLPSRSQEVIGVLARMCVGDRLEFDVTCASGSEEFWSGFFPWMDPYATSEAVCSLPIDIRKEFSLAEVYSALSRHREERLNRNLRRYSGKPTT